MQTITYVRKPLTVEAIQVTRANFYEVAAWVEGDVVTDGGGKKFIEVKVLHPARRGHSQAYVGDWLLKSEAGYKIYADTAFRKGFDPADEQLELTREELGFAGIDPDKVTVVRDVDLSHGSVSLDIQAPHFDGKNFFGSPVLVEDSPLVHDHTSENDLMFKGVKS